MIEDVARGLVAEGKGILAADESTRTMTKRLRAIRVESTIDSRREFRELLVTTPGVGKFISGMILFDETIRQRTSDGRPFPEAVADAGMITGIKVDTGAKPLAGSPQEKVTEGLDGLRDRLVEYRRRGARFAKWRAVIAIGERLPTRACVDANAHALARSAALCQEAGLVPIVEPEVLMEGDHPIERCAEVTEQTLHQVYRELFGQGVALEGTLLKPNMVLAGEGCPEQADVEEVAQATVRCMREVVPAAVPGIVFLSGGQDDRRASAHLNAINRLGPQPWELSFSFGRALQAAALEAWGGKREGRAAAQRAFGERARWNGAARNGRHTRPIDALAPA